MNDYKDYVDDLDNLINSSKRETEQAIKAAQAKLAALGLSRNEIVLALQRAGYPKTVLEFQQDSFAEAEFCKLAAIDPQLFAYVQTVTQPIDETQAMIARLNMLVHKLQAML